MTDDLLKAAKDEEKRLLARLHAVRGVIALYSNGAMPAVEPQPITRQRFRLRLAETKTARVINGSSRFLRQKQARATSGEIAKALSEIGLEIAPKLVASYLSNSDLFDNKPGAGGYGLVEWEKNRAAGDTSSA